MAARLRPGVTALGTVGLFRGDADRTGHGRPVSTRLKRMAVGTLVTAYNQ